MFSAHRDGGFYSELYNIDLEDFTKVPLKEDAVTDSPDSAHSIVIDSPSGVRLYLDTTLENAESGPVGAWDFVLRKELASSYLHRYFRSAPDRSTVKLRVRVTAETDQGILNH